MIFSLIISLVLTLIIELIISLIIGIREKEDIKIIICANVLTNPIVVFIANIVILLDNNIIYDIVVAILEISAFITEAIIFKKLLKFNKISPWLISFINNLISFSLGVIINLFIR